MTKRDTTIPLRARSFRRRVALVSILAIPCVVGAVVLARQDPKPRPAAQQVKPPNGSASAVQARQTPRADETRPRPGRGLSQATSTEKSLEFGKSVRGAPLIMYVLGTGPDVTMVLGGVHGNEAATPGVVEALRRELRTSPDLLDGATVILVPRVNPDGLARGTRANAQGVDLNRNFNVGWESKALKARNNPGPRALSEPESRAVAGLVERFRPAKVVAIHQPLHMMNYTGEVGKRVAAAMQRHNKYRMSGDIGYPTPGSFGDFCGARKIGIVTLELPPVTSDQAWKDNRTALLEAITLRKGNNR